MNELDRWILSKLQNLIKKCTENLDRYIFNIPLEDIRTFVWHDLADNYLEMVKHRLYKPGIYGDDSKRSAQYTMKKVLETILKLLSPFTPHICDEIWENIFRDGYVTVAEWPELEEGLLDKEAEDLGEMAKEIIAEIRKYKSEKGIPLSSEIEHVRISADSKYMNKIKRIEEDIKGTGKIKNLEIVIGEKLRLDVL